MRFAADDHEQDPVDLEPNLIDLFRHLNTPQAIPLYLEILRRDPIDIPDEIIEAFVKLGPAAVEPLLAVLDDMKDDDTSDVLFLLAALRVRDQRILDVLLDFLHTAPTEAAHYLDMHGDPAAIPALEAELAKTQPEEDYLRRCLQSAITGLSLSAQFPPEPPDEFDMWPLYDETASPLVEILSEEDQIAMLGCGCAEFRKAIAEHYWHSVPPQRIAAVLLKNAKNDPDLAVRGACWEVFGFEVAPEIREAMLAVLADPQASVEEKGGVILALANLLDHAVLFEPIEQLYADPRGRAQALKAMARTRDLRFADYPPKHLSDPDVDVKRQAISAVGFLGLGSEASRLEPLFDDEEFRADALFAYALSVPGDISHGRMQALFNKIRAIAGGFQDEDEANLVRLGLDHRLLLKGERPFFTADLDDDEEEDELESPAPASKKVGRNDPCPCGSGKKYKKCCGAT